MYMEHSHDIILNTRTVPTCDQHTQDTILYKGYNTVYILIHTQDTILYKGYNTVYTYSYILRIQYCIMYIHTHTYSGYNTV